MEEKKSIHCTLTDHELAAKADQWIDELIASGGKSFTMRVPARPNADTDLILAELNNRFKKSIGQSGAAWVKADTKPEHNVGVLVFIPGEDNHITSGMWDIDNKWVLLDEYRTPDCEVTHWTRLPAFPDGYPHDVISDEWVSTLKAIAKDELSKKGTAAGREEDFTEFDADFMRECDLYPTSNGVTIITENDEGASIDIDDITKLAVILKRYAATFKQNRNNENG